MKKPINVNKHFYGTTTIGEKGQAVIPIEARQNMDLKKGDKLLVLGMDSDMIVLSKFSKLEQFASNLSEHLDAIKTIIKKNKIK
ncbi:MAG: AbrB/MazE/SpoVT family DNA-binding domain-containing protein [Candidatus Paceibacterota bacterium]